MSTALIGISLYFIIGLALGLIHYFRNSRTDTAAIAELVAISLTWLIVGLLYVIVEAIRAFWGGDDDESDSVGSGRGSA